ncbi:MAG: glycoside hydrolase family 32 protein [Bacteroides sp.]|nr:glycoside hydrolase family 32 protein [Bacteroides sp.]
MKFLNIMTAAMLSLPLLTLTACGDDSKVEYITAPETPSEGEDDNSQEPVASSDYDELYRPQIHFTPKRNWMNDPNGMVYNDGIYHLFFQHNPSGNDWGNMSWGHATSSDMIHWEEQPVALKRDELGDIFSGCAVIDKDNTAGFGAGALVVFYTSADQYQQQSMAYSLDNGVTFTRYAGNPVIPSTLADFRDPKVFYHQESKQWVMALAKGWNYGIDFWGSSDLKSWKKLSEFTSPIDRCNKGQWECPDLLRMNFEGKEKWVLIVSVNPGGPAGGSGTMYFVGDFDGTNFTADSLDYPLWLDYGPDNYAGVTWSNTGDRTLLIGWMNNWNYAGATPTSPWRSAMTLPRELKLISYDGKPLLANTVAKEIDGIAGEWKDVSLGNVMPVEKAYQLRMTVDLSKNGSFTLYNEAGEKAEFTVNAAAGKLIMKRNASTGNTSFNGNFSLPSIQAPLNMEGAQVVLDIFVDGASVEVFTENGSMALTAIVFPGSLYNMVSADGISDIKVRNLNRIW